jgi:hypothetical protein
LQKENLAERFPSMSHKKLLNIYSYRIWWEISIHFPQKENF